MFDLSFGDLSPCILWICFTLSRAVPKPIPWFLCMNWSFLVEAASFGGDVLPWGPRLVVVFGFWWSLSDPGELGRELVLRYGRVCVGPFSAESWRALSAEKIVAILSRAGTLRFSMEGFAADYVNELILWSRSGFPTAANPSRSTPSTIWIVPPASLGILNWGSWPPWCRSLFKVNSWIFYSLWVSWIFRVGF